MTDLDQHRWPDGPNTVARRRRHDRAVGAFVAVSVLLLSVSGFLGVTSQTGFPGPGALRRYPVADLQDLADRLNRTGCSPGPDLPPERVATVDWLRSRVHLSTPGSVALAPEDRALVDDPPVGAWSTAPTSMATCVGMTGAG